MTPQRDNPSRSATYHGSLEQESQERYEFVARRCVLCHLPILRTDAARLGSHTIARIDVPLRASPAIQGQLGTARNCSSAERPQLSRRQTARSFFAALLQPTTAMIVEATIANPDM
jgi:hypothetical protein